MKNHLSAKRVFPTSGVSLGIEISKHFFFLHAKGLVINYWGGGWLIGNMHYKDKVLAGQKIKCRTIRVLSFEPCSTVPYTS
jgi:hypothetical protein